MKFFAAPLQGLTEAPWRRAHKTLFDGVDAYCAPFMRVERGEPRRRDIRDISENEVIPQVLFRDVDEFRILVGAVKEAGHSRVDLNLGCPFPPQVKHGRGAALIGRPDLIEEIGRIAREEFPEMKLSVKMRIGVSEPDQWRDSIRAIEALQPVYMAVHPRVAADQYKGELHMEQFDAVMAEVSTPVVYNGELHTPEDVAEIVARYPGLYGVMAGRGLITRPSLADEWRSGREMTPGERLGSIRNMLRMIGDELAATLTGGEHQVLAKMKPYWELLEPEVGHAAAKAVKKARTLAAYNAIVENL